MFAWIESLHNKLHTMETGVRARFAELEARIAALEGKTPTEPGAPTPLNNETTQNSS